MKNCGDKLSRSPISGEPEVLCKEEGPFRPNVAALILRRRGKQVEILLGERVDAPGAWQWPQGGVDVGETERAAVLRELREEIGVTKAHVLYTFPHRLSYRFPARLAGKFKPFVGQEQTYFIVKLEEGDPPNLENALTKEFQALRWAPLDDALDSAIWFKRDVYRKALNHARDLAETLEF